MKTLLQDSTEILYLITFVVFLSLRRWLKGSNHWRSVQHQIVIKQDCWTRKIVARLLLPAHRGNNSFHLVVVGFNRAKWLREKVRRKTEYLFLFSRYLCGILGWRKLSGLETRTLFFFSSDGLRRKLALDIFLSSIGKQVAPEGNMHLY